MPEKYSNARTLVPVEPRSGLLGKVMLPGCANAKTLGYFEDEVLTGLVSAIYREGFSDDA